MQVGVAYADKFKQVWLKIDVPQDCSVRDAIERSGLLEQFPEIDLENQRVGIFGKLTKLDAALEEGNRVVISSPHIPTGGP